jgi:predicted RNase H-like nuclease (RuvC/YqgF family)
MIKIKNYIFNEKEIVSIEPISDGLRVDLKSKSDYIDIYATFEDIEWNYGNNISESLSYDLAKARIEELEEKNKRLEERVGQFSNTINDLGRTNVNIQRKINNILKDTEELYKMAKEQDSDNVNLIDRLENILKTLKGE